MQIRHRIPTIFNLSMVDVLCCALGCVILLWLINMREFKVRASAAAEKGRLLESTRTTLEETYREAATIRRQLQAAEKQSRDTAALLQKSRSDRDLLDKDLEAARIRLMQLEKDALALKDRNAAADERLAKLSKEQQILTRERSDILQRITDLEKLLKEKDVLASAARRQADDLAGRLRDSEDRVRQLRSTADMLEKSRARLSDVETRAQSMEKDLDAWKRELADARRVIVGLEQDKKSLSDKALRAQIAVENRFAGITLSGRRVLFLIDMSGSMELIDEKTPAPDKWQAVRETVAKIMRSLQDMERFQIVLFSDRVEFPLRSEYDWTSFDPKTSVDRVLAALAGVRPKGNTNVHAGLQAAFRFRQAGLDTIYFVSDGLPTTGDGLSSEQARTLKETERTEILSKYVRTIVKTDWNRELAGKPRVRVNTLGFFYESPEVGAFLWALARENEGSFVGMSKP